MKAWLDHTIEAIEALSGDVHRGLRPDFHEQYAVAVRDAQRAFLGQQLRDVLYNAAVELIGVDAVRYRHSGTWSTQITDIIESVSMAAPSADKTSYAAVLRRVTAAAEILDSK